MADLDPSKKIKSVILVQTYVKINGWDINCKHLVDSLLGKLQFWGAIPVQSVRKDSWWDTGLKMLDPGSYSEQQWTALIYGLKPTWWIFFLVVCVTLERHKQPNELCDFEIERQANVWQVYEIAKSLLVSKSWAHTAGEYESTHDSVFRPMTHTVSDRYAGKTARLKWKTHRQKTTNAATGVIFVTWPCYFLYELAGVTISLLLQLTMCNNEWNW